MSDIDVADLRDFLYTQISDMLGHPVDASKDFMGAGGDSYDAVMLAYAIEERYGLAVDVVDIVDAESIASLCVQLASACRRGSAELPNREHAARNTGSDQG